MHEPKTAAPLQSVGRKAAWIAAVTLLLTALVVIGPVRSGSLTAAVSGADEAPHFVTGMMVREYLRQGMPGPPMQFAQRYYDSYPKVAMGHWPPLFYLVEALWFLAAPVTKTWLFALMSLFGALPGVWLVLHLHHQGWPRIAAVAVGAVWATLPLVHGLTVEVHLELVATSIMFAATLWFGRFLDSGKTRDAVWFGALAALACLVKPNALALALVPPIAMVVGRRWDLPRKKGVWWSAVVVVVVALPWYLFAWEWIRGESHPGQPASWVALYTRLTLIHLANIFLSAGILPCVAAIPYVVSAVRARQGRDIALLSSIAAVLLFHSIVAPHGGVRHMVYGLPAVILLAAEGARRYGGWVGAVGILLAGSLVARVLIPPGTKVEYGFVAASRYARSQPDGVWLVSSCATGEGALIAELAQLEPRPRHRIVRATKLLVRSNWMANHYTLLARTTEEVKQLLRSSDAEWIVADRVREPCRMPHHRIVTAFLEENASEWRREFSGGEVTIYRRVPL